MNLKLGEIYSGFKLIEEKQLKELNSTGRIFLHEKSGARLLHIENEDDNKVFSVSFRTPPKNSTGVAHILEHSVLCGSRKFPSKEPFVELIKGSLNTFLNAFTFPDKTMYPVASRNDKDFTNLMDVYLDAVLHPNIYKYPEIMMQEGWHYELEKKEDELKYKGVVYNEMKGAYASPESVLFRKIQQSLYPDTSYGVESGGDPDVIPELTQEEFTGFHKKYYHPSNCYMFLYGNMDITDKLKFIDENYLQEFDKIEVDSRIKEQKPFETQRTVVEEYPILQSEKENDKTYMSLNYVIGKSDNAELVLAFDILEFILLETSSSPLKRALIEANLGKDVFGTYESEILQPMFSIVVKNSNETEAERFKKVVFDTLSQITSTGLDKKLVDSAINSREFLLREADFHGYPKGLIYSMKSMGSWLYDVSPFVHLQYEEALAKIKSQKDNNYFENMIKEYILYNNNSSMVIVKPKKGLAEEKAEQLKEKLRKYKDSLSEEQLGRIIEDTKRLQERQRSKDTKENVEKIPLLAIEDIDRKVEDLPLVQDEVEGIKLLKHPVFTNKIVYANMYFDTSYVEEEKIPYVALLAGVLGKVSTEKHDFQQLSNEVNMVTGGIRYNADVLSDNLDDKGFLPVMSVKCKFLEDKMEEALSLVGEIAGSTKFDNAKRVKEVIDELKSRLEMIMFDRGHLVAASRALSYCSKLGRYSDMIGGFGYYKFLSSLAEDFDGKKDEVLGNLKEVYKKVFNVGALTLSITAEENALEEVKSKLHLMHGGLCKEEQKPCKYQLACENRKEGLMTSSKVQYVAKAFNFTDAGFKYNGSMQVLRSVVNYDYLWNKVRVQGGAYGCFSAFRRNGNMFLTSYRDPNLVGTMEAYDGIGDFLEKFNPTEREMRKYVIGTISDLDMPLSPSMKGERSDEYYMRHVTLQDLQRERDEVLSSTMDQMKEYAPLVKEAMKGDFLCVLGNEDKIKENEKLFNNLINVFE